MAQKKYMIYFSLVVHEFSEKSLRRTFLASKLRTTRSILSGLTILRVPVIEAFDIIVRLCPLVVEIEIAVVDEEKLGLKKILMPSGREVNFPDEFRSVDLLTEIGKLFTSNKNNSNPDHNSKPANNI